MRSPRTALASFVAVGAMIALGIFAAPTAAAADTVKCAKFGGLNTQPGVQPVPNFICATKAIGRGYRGYIEFYAVQTYQSVGRFFVKLERNGVKVAQSAVHVNPVFPGPPSVPYMIATPWVSSGAGHYCTILRDSRTIDLNYTVEKWCWDLP